ncbi:MAG: LytTR family DNA-binding domain-containing protein [Clostridiales bacterium]|nr:LytTR family DNA-binding domain-containing protein [Clostridiales bacterium]
MIRIALVDDEVEQLEQFHQYLAQYQEERQVEVEAVDFPDGDEFLERYQTPFDIVLMDVQMRFLDGMTTAERLREIDPAVIIIFITNMPQYAIRGYAVDALDYVLKPLSYFAFAQRLDRARQRLNKRERHYITLQVRGGVQKLDVMQIHYVESQKHDLLFHTSGEVYTTRGTMKSAETLLADYPFFRCNKCYLVNLEHVDSIRENEAMVEGTPLVVSRGCRNDFMTALAAYVGSAM